MNSKLNTILFGGRGAATVAGDIGLALLRVFAGLSMALAHGRSKVFPTGGGFGPSDGFIQGTGDLGFPLPAFFAWCAALGEFLGGLLVAVGLFTRPAAAMAAITMAVAAFVAHRSDPFATKEMALLYLAIFVMFVCTGAGHISADAMIRTWDRKPANS